MSNVDAATAGKKPKNDKPKNEKGPVLPSPLTAIGALVLKAALNKYVGKESGATAVTNYSPAGAAALTDAAASSSSAASTAAATAAKGPENKVTYDHPEKATLYVVWNEKIPKLAKDRDAYFGIVRDRMVAERKAQAKKDEKPKPPTDAEVTAEAEHTMPLLIDQLQAECQTIIDDNFPLSALTKSPYLLTQANIDAALAHIPGHSVASTTSVLQNMQLLKSDLKKNLQYSFEFVVGATALNLVQKAAEQANAKASKKTADGQKAAGASGSASAVSSSAKPAASSASQAKSVADANKVDFVVAATDEIYEKVILPAIAKLQSANTAAATPSTATAPSTSTSSLTPAELMTLEAQLRPLLSAHLTSLANAAYSRGFKAGTTGSGNYPLDGLL